MNLITDPWIPVVREFGVQDVIRPDQIAEPDVHRFNWPRADLNLACHELLIGLVYLACPPVKKSQRDEFHEAEFLRSSFAPLAQAFELLGDGPRFLQDFEALEGSPNAPDMLFIDSAGENTAKKNADVFVHRDRYPVLPLPLAAMALYTLQAFAPSGGRGNRTSMRGGGPMVTLIKPRRPGLWPLIWANVPCGVPLDPNALVSLPWMRPTVTSEKGQTVTSDTDVMAGPAPEMFFGQPRRLRLVGDASGVTGVIQRPYGTNYGQWVHHLSPYYRDSKGQLLPMHPKPGPFGYRNWRGVLLKDDKRRQSVSLKEYPTGPNDPPADLIVAGWAMEKWTPLDFLWSEQPIFQLDSDAEDAAIAMVEAAEKAAFALAVTLRTAMGENDITSGVADTARRAFFLQTQEFFERRVGNLSKGQTPDHVGWLGDLSRVAMSLFDAQVLPGLSQLQDSRRTKAVDERKRLKGAFFGYGGLAKKIYQPLELELPAKPKSKETA